MPIHLAAIEPLEYRRLFSFAKLDPTFGDGGTTPVATTRLGSYYGDRIFTLNDGGFITQIGDRQFRRFDSAGKRVESYGEGDATIDLNAKSRAILSAVDARTGRVAVIAANGSNNASKLNIYSAAGKLERSVANVELGSIVLANVDKMVFDSSGRLVMSAPNDLLIARVNVSTGRLDPKFAGDGIATLLPAGGDRNNGTAGLAIGPGDVITVARVSYTEATTSTNRLMTTYLDIDRFNAKGRGVNTFGTAGTLRTAIGHTVRNLDNAPTDATFDTTSAYDMASAPDGSTWLLEATGHIRTTETVSNSTAGTQIQQIRDDGTLAKPIDLAGRITDYGGGERRLFVDASSRIWVVGSREIVRLTAKRKFDDAFNGDSGMAAFGASQSVFKDAALDAQNRVIFFGNTGHFSGSTDVGTSLRAYSGVTESFGTKSGRAALVNDGILDVAGTTGNDSVRLRYVGTKLRVEINSRVQLFHSQDISGILIHTGNGDDNVRVDAGIYNVSIFGGAGNDRLTGGDFADYIDGGSGNDYVDGHAAGDVLLGRDGDDTLRGSEGQDSLDGGTGDDVLFGSDELGADDWIYNSGNTLIGGAGVDRFVASKHDEAKEQFDLLRDRSGEDIVG